MYNCKTELVVTFCASYRAERLTPLEHNETAHSPDSPSKPYRNITKQSFTPLTSATPHSRKNSQTPFPHLTALLYVHMPGAFPLRNPSTASANAGPSPSSLICCTGYRYVLKEKRMARVCGRRVSVWSSMRRNVYTD